MTAGDPRPRPQYGEYADEAGEAAHDESARSPSEPAAAPAPARSERPTVAGSPATASAHSPLPGVPHNLGVSGERPPQQAPRPLTAPPSAPPSAPPLVPGPTNAQSPTTAQPTRGEPYRAAPPAGAQTPQSPALAPAPGALPDPATLPQPTQASGARGRIVDRIITILLLALGAYGALSSGLAMLQLEQQLRVLGSSILEIDGYTVPQSVGTIGTVGSVLILTIFALCLIFSIQRLRARKLAFWVPLSAGALAFIVVFLCTMIAYAQSPELLQAMAQPDAAEKVFAFAANEEL